MIKTAIISDLHDWHSNKIEYFLKKNGCSVIKLSFEEIEFYFKNNKKKIFKNNISNVDSVWVRFIKNGSLEEITTKLTFLHLLQNLKVYTHNSANVIEKTVDKIRTTGLLKINGIDSPNTTVWIGKKKIKLEKTSLIKPIFGSQGKGIKLIRKGEYLNKYIPIGNVYYLQEFIDKFDSNEYRDIRILVSNHQVIACMERTSKFYLTNIYQGASNKKVHPNKKLIDVAKKVSRVLGLGYGGIDIKICGSKLFVLEVNSIPSWKAIDSVHKQELSERLVSDFIKITKKFKKCQKN